MSKKIKLLVISGSMRSESYSSRVLELAKNKADSLGVQTELINLRNLKLPFCDGGTNYSGFPDLERFRQSVKKADALILVTPEYHGSVSGALKNAIDLLDYEHLEGKACALIAICGGIANTGAVNTLRIVCRWLHAHVIPEQLVISEVETAFDETGKFRNPAYDASLEKLVSRLVLFAGLFQQE
jgi:NAD(P)H-dependent FMN reductase